MRKCLPGVRFLIPLSMTCVAWYAFAQEIAGTYVHVRDSDGTTPRAGARLALTFSGGASGVVTLYATRPGETVRDSGSYSLRNRRITIQFKEVDWEAKDQPVELDNCVLTLPFKAVSAKEGPGTSTWRRQDAKCSDSGAAGQPASNARAEPPKPAPISAVPRENGSGLTIGEKIMDRNGRLLRERNSFYTEARSRIDDGGWTVIVDFGLGKYRLLDNRKKAYIELAVNDMDSQVSAANGQMRSYMGQNDMKDFLGALTNSSQLRIVPTHENRVVNGFPAQKVEVHRGRDLVLEGWYSSKVGTREFQAFMEQAVARSQAAYYSPWEGAQVFKATRELGYPVLVKDYRRGTTVEVVGVKEGKPTDSVFAVPAGYRKVAAGELFPGS